MGDASSNKTLSAKCHIYESLRAKILNHDLPCGHRLLEAEVASTYNTSRTPARRALSALERERLIEHKAGRGWFVSSLAPSDAREVVVVRAILEGHAARLGALSFDARAIGELEQTLRLMDKAIDNMNTPLLESLNKHFHRMIYRACPNRILVSLLEALLEKYPNLAFEIPQEVAEQRQREHYRITEALVTGHQDRVCQLVSSHISEHFEHIIRRSNAETETRALGTG
jgi:DNA-binding GntR family transcriptional regulator